MNLAGSLDKKQGEGAKGRLRVRTLRRKEERSDNRQSGNERERREKQLNSD